MAKNEQLKIKGLASWAKVFQPDTKYDKKGIYSINVIVPEDQAAKVCERLDEIAEANAQKIVKEQSKLKATLSTRLPYETDYDDNGDPTGNILFKVKMKAAGTTRDGKEFTQKPLVVDAKRTPMTGDVLIGNDSVVKVAFEPSPYYAAAQKQAGVTLRLKGVQVLTLKEFRGNSADTMFDEEDGYETKAEKDNIGETSGSDMFDDEVQADAEGDF